MKLRLLKKLIKGLFNDFGYDITKLDRDDIQLYLDLYDSESVKNKRFYNIGGGGNSSFHSAWSTIDFTSEWYKGSKHDINFDLFSLKEFPIEEDSAEIVYSSHTIEHINDKAAQNMFNESFRILKPGGTIRITAPDVDLDYRAYRDNDRNYFYWKDSYSLPGEVIRAKLACPMNDLSIGEIFLSHFAASVSPLYLTRSNELISDEELKLIFSKMKYEDALNYCTSKCPMEIQKSNSGNHINWWNEDKMFRMLKEAGFKKIFHSGHGQSFLAPLRNLTYFDSTYYKVSVYVEAIK